MVENASKRLLLRSHMYHPEYGAHLTNHLPMGVIALSRMAATPQDLERYFEAELNSMNPPLLPPEDAPLAVGERPPFGRSVPFEVHRFYFEQEVERHGRDETLARHLPDLIPGVGAAAFHGLIRLAYAIQSDCEEELACALAYWSYSYLDLPPITEASRELTLAETIGVLARRSTDISMRFHHLRTTGKPIFEKMAHLSQVASIAEVCDAVQLQGTLDDSIREIRACAARIFFADDSFTALHLVTSAHALRVVGEQFTDEIRRPLLHAYVRNLVLCTATLSSLRRASLATWDSEAIAEVDADWDQLQRVAIESMDTHTIKLIHTCRDEYRVDGDALYAALATRRTHPARSQ